MASFPILTIPKGYKLYRSFTDDKKKIGNWFGFEASTTYGYGDKTAEFITTRDLKILDISKKEFYDNYTKDMIRYINDGHNISKASALFPIGFDDKSLYKEYAQKIIGLDASQFQFNPDLHIISNLEFSNRSRCSVHQFDEIFVKIVRDLYSSFCDGFGCSLNFPDTIRNGFQHPEIMVFDNTLITYTNDISRNIMSGGDYICGYHNGIPVRGGISIDNEFTRKLKENLEQYEAEAKDSVPFKPRPYKLKVVQVLGEPPIEEQNTNKTRKKNKK